MNKVAKPTFKKLVEEKKFRELLSKMGWEEFTGVPLSIGIGEDNNFTLKPIAALNDFKIYSCERSNMPGKKERRKIHEEVTKSAKEHLLIFVDTEKGKQIWSYLTAKGQTSETNTSIEKIHVEVVHTVGKDVAHLYQRFSDVFFRLEEDIANVTDVVLKLDKYVAVNIEKVTKKFYDQFKKHHKTFKEHITGIQEDEHVDWYASVMLNRLMFCYFIQKKDLLDGNKNYLKDKLEECKNGTYPSFLMVLFHKGLGAIEHTEIGDMIGRVPYLNGGIFEEHEIEKSNSDINIPDEAFKDVFDFFDKFQWHLDPSKNDGNEINPDVLGYIFEKYINDRASMGAYYTKEDITEYIGKNCIIPFLFDKVQEEKSAKREIQKFFETLKNSDPDIYIYDAIKYGCDPDKLWGDLPDDICEGLDPNQPNLYEIRKAWNTPAPPDVALPTELWREVIERRKRYEELRKVISEGGIASINDFITYNLDIRLFCHNCITMSESPNLVYRFYEAVRNITVLDPTCGSGAFLFAALDILEVIYSDCIRKMQIMVDSKDSNLIESLDPDVQKEWKAIANPLSNVRKALAELTDAPNPKYFIYKSIILRNLYGVDIMKEAVETAKLRLFLKLIASAQKDPSKPNLGIEPLPDIDFNIRTGNALVGFATEAELQNGLAYTLDGAIAKPLIEERCEIVANAFKRYKEIQLTYGDDFKEFKKAKTELNNRLKELNHELNQLLHKQATAYKYEDWLQSHQPFHWFAEFYEILQDNGGFDVIIGNPPYVEYSKVRKTYTIKNYQTESCGNLYAYVMEVATKIISLKGRIGVIIPLASFSTKRMNPLQRIYLKRGNSLYISNFEATSNPTTLFIGVKVQLSIVLWESSKTPKSIDSIQLYTTNYKRCYTAERNFLLDNISYVYPKILDGYITRMSSSIEQTILTNLFKHKALGNFISASRNNSTLYYRNMGNFFFKLAFQEEPKYYKDGVEQTSSTVSKLFAKTQEDSLIITGLINSSLFYYYWILFSDCYHLSKSDISNFPFDLEKLTSNQKNDLVNSTKMYLKSIEDNSVWQIENKKDGTTKKYRRYFPQTSKVYSDEIDTVLAKHYGFTDEELDFIINYDIKYRMGKELYGGESEGEDDE